MDFIRYVFSFLYVRNWHTGKKELSHVRLFIFFSLIFMLLLALTIIGILEQPVTYFK